MKSFFGVLGVLFFATIISANTRNYNTEFVVDTLAASNRGYSEIELCTLANEQLVICYDVYASVSQSSSIIGSFIHCLNANGQQIGHHTIGSTFDHSTAPDVTSMPTGNFMASWKSGGSIEPGMYVQQFDSLCQTVGAKVRMDSNEFAVNVYQALIAANDTSYMCVCTGLLPATFDIVTIGKEINYNGNIRELFYIDDINLVLSRRQIIRLPNDEFLVCWKDIDKDYNHIISIRKINSQGHTDIVKFDIVKMDNGQAVVPVLSLLKQDTILLCWTEPDQHDIGIWAQIFDTDGNTRSDKFLVNTKQAGDQYIPYVQCLNDDRFILTWTSMQEDLKSNICAQLFDCAGNKINREFIINSAKDGFNTIPRIAAYDNGDFAICWLNINQYQRLMAKYYLAEPVNHTLIDYSVNLPQNNEELLTKRPEFIWQTPSAQRICYPWEIQYDLYLSTDEDFSDPIIYTDLQDSSFTLPQADSLQAGDTYFWKVLAKNISGDSLCSSNTNAFFVSHTATGVEEESSLPTGYVLEQNYPNPFNPVTTVRYTLPQMGMVELALYDITGRRVKTLVQGMQSAGTHSVQIDGHDLASGVYLYTLKAGAYTQSKKMVLIK